MYKGLTCETKLHVQGTTCGPTAGNQSVKYVIVVAHEPRQVMRDQIMLKNLKSIL